MVKKIALIGGGPASLFMYKKLLENNTEEGLEIIIFEKKNQLGAGFPYSISGAMKEHITNVSGNEIPNLPQSMKDWIATTDTGILKPYDINSNNFNEFKVVPRLLFGMYLQQQFELLIKQSKLKNIKTTVWFNTTVKDVEYDVSTGLSTITDDKNKQVIVNDVVICTGHVWPKNFEGKVDGWYDSPYPPQKLKQTFNAPVALKGASLTAIDAIRTLAHANGEFIHNADSTYTYQLNEQSRGFSMVLHSLHGYLPAVRFHLEDTHLTPKNFIEEKDVPHLKQKFGGYIPLDFIFKTNFVDPLREQDSKLYEIVKNFSIEEFVVYMFKDRENNDGFHLLKQEYKEAEESIENRTSVIWKETLGALSYAMNYPAKHMSAEDMLRLKKVLMPLVSLIIAYVPQSSCRELLALHDAGVISLISVDESTDVQPAENGGAVYFYDSEKNKKVYYKTYINAIGQAPMQYNDFPFESLKKDGIVSSAYLHFKDDTVAEEELAKGNKLVVPAATEGYYLKVPGLNINDHFQVLNSFGAFNPNIYIMAVPFIGGLNPDYSGLDFCDTASDKIAETIFKKEPTVNEIINKNDYVHS
jgi:uncharacterized NAD(P)/FAD-binding protein YdhS